VNVVGHYDIRQVFAQAFLRTHLQLVNSNLCGTVRGKNTTMTVAFGCYEVDTADFRESAFPQLMTLVAWHTGDVAQQERPSQQSLLGRSGLKALLQALLKALLQEAGPDTVLRIRIARGDAKHLAHLRGVHDSR